MSKMIVKIPNGYLVVEKKGTENEYPGVLVFFSKDGEHYSTDDIVACVEYDTLEEVIKTETYVKGQEEPTNIVCWGKKGGKYMIFERNIRTGSCRTDLGLCQYIGKNPRLEKGWYYISVAYSHLYGEYSGKKVFVHTKPDYTNCICCIPFDPADWKN